MDRNLTAAAVALTYEQGSSVISYITTKRDGQPLGGASSSAT